MRLLEGSGPLGPLLPEHISEFVVGIVLFVIVFFAVRKFVVPRFETMYAAREEAIRGGIERAEQAQAEAQAALTRYQGLLDAAEDEAAQIRDRAKVAGEAVQTQLRGQAEQEAARIVATGRAQVQAERQEAMSSLRNDVGQLATTLAGKLLGESLTDDARVARTVDSFIVSITEASHQS
jgi:F-type H+-transporting ATPase subunit b